TTALARGEGPVNPNPYSRNIWTRSTLIRAVGRRAAVVVPASIALEIFSQGTPIFDWLALQRLGLSERNLTAGSIVRDPPNTFWEHYKWLLLPFLAILIIEAVLIDILLRERRRRHFAQQRLEEEFRLKQLVAELSGTFVNLPADKVE